MNIDLTDTTSSQINTTLVQARRSIGSPAVGMVLTMVIVTDEGNHYDALKAASEASKEHPSRILAVIRRPGRSPRDRATARLDAEVRVGSDSGTGETVLLRLHGELASHAYSVVLPLLLPDAPVVVWWPEDAPDNPSQDRLGTLGQRRITDAAASEDPLAALRLRGETYAPGDTDLSWTRLTPWRSVLAAGLDQQSLKVRSAVVEGEAHNPSTELLALWLSERLRVPVEREVTDGPGITAVRMATADGDICLDRADGSLAELAVPGQPDRHVALHRRGTAELIAEELRRLDPDEAYASAVQYGTKQTGRGRGGNGGGTGGGRGNGGTGGGGGGGGSRTGKSARTHAAPQPEEESAKQPAAAKKAARSTAKRAAKK
ncbi:glucose-6-phosphate dehydrogenase assembly protein OpcA [Streptomyces sp. HNM0575]|uniref:glucose-6-phosphate dehydrogenase assembly protein OpcA n=1 Tax=Streptomyces sp. HNM0575 TaxID=2716338 RepID=UPI00145E326B|nr:glucose-6-phosphate dehydrogenase assembly protein OpcA [Streptomyces sp. HNM0575]NLU74714.1 glucose-6-phosphate dehydrogenase assembly protein OpcA [Streptomyces sp. HNM0575]